MDRNFDDIAHRFTQTIYQKPRGKLRLVALQQDFQDFGLPVDTMRVLDLGAGQGQFALWLAQRGAQVCLCEHSEEMLSVAKEHFTQASLAFKAHQCTLQTINQYEPEPFNLVLNHAVLEWLDEPFLALDIIAEKVATNGWLSIMFYQRSGHVWRQLMNGRLHDPEGGNAYLKNSGNAPKHSFDSDEVFAYLQAKGFELKRQRGIRCIYDHMNEKIRQKMDEQALFEADLKYGLVEPYRQLGRYVHLLLRKTL